MKILFKSPAYVYMLNYMGSRDVYWISLDGWEKWLLELKGIDKSENI
jgi:hypothetical protein